MAKITLAGGTSTFARDIIDAILAKGKHEITVLSRQAAGRPEEQNVKQIAVNYDDSAELVRVLRGSDVLLCFFPSFDPATAVSRQKNLIDAAIKANVRRFAPSEWATRSNSGTVVFAFKDEVRKYLEEVNKEKKVLEYTLFQPGLFTDFFGHPYKGTKHFDSSPMLVDFETRNAVMAGDGNHPFVLTTVHDVAAVVAEAIEYSGEWPVVGGITGTRTTVAELVKLGEQLRGPFNIEKVQEADIEAGTLTASWFPIFKHHGIPAGQEIPVSKFTTQQFIHGTMSGAWDVSNEWNELLPHLSFATAEEYLAGIWTDGSSSSTDDMAATAGDTGETGPISASLPINMTIAGFFAVACYNCVEILISLANRFKRHDGLYFWSMLVATLGIILHSIVVLLRYYSLGPNFRLCVLTCVGWYGMVTGQSVVLYSRLHLIVPDKSKTRWVLIMIIINFFILHVPVTVLFLGSNTRDSHRFLAAFNIYERVQLAGFFVQESIISGLYIWETARGLKPIFAVKKAIERKVIRHLIIVNILVIILDISLLVTQYLSHFQIQTTYKPVVYSIKLKMEFVVLNKLVLIVQHNECNCIEVVDGGGVLAPRLPDPIFGQNVASTRTREEAIQLNHVSQIPTNPSTSTQASTHALNQKSPFTFLDMTDPYCTLYNHRQSAKMPRMNLGLPYNHCGLGRCPVGFQTQNLLRCGACHVVKYCGQEHQRADRPRHKVSCNMIKEQKAKVAEEENKLRTNPGDDTGGNAFETVVGQFWFFRSTRPYMQARFDYISALLNIRTGEAVELALDHSLDMLRLCRGDNLGVRAQVPGLYLRMGRDQDAYDFIKWYAEVTSDYEWGNPDLPYLDKHGEDVFEPVDEKPHHIKLSFFIALTLIKIRVMKDLESLQKFLRKNPNASGEARYDHLAEEAMSDVLLQRADIVAQDDYKETIAELRRQALQLYKMVKEQNPHFWPGVMDPNLYAYSVPSIYTPGSREEAVLVFRQSWYSWSETEPAIQFIREVIRKDK
ncbi:hypothetical protein FALBO_7247 [Fusarium albosuccineum]|uniref:MYND-type domain-containing protein n=1 Tax=Fusarium albosuccineum TaxID=1237068 RepID=A0A8H4P839_9HYPO|nr:hypothetical protein FALBO_7247 [Fusarium albosuccineum]